MTTKTIKVYVDFCRYNSLGLNSSIPYVLDPLLAVINSRATLMYQATKIFLTVAVTILFGVEGVIAQEFSPWQVHGEGPTITEASLELDVAKLLAQETLTAQCKSYHPNATLTWEYPSIETFTSSSGSTYRVTETASCIISLNVFPSATGTLSSGTITGIELEDEGGSGSTQSHFENRLYRDEIMNAAGGTKIQPTPLPTTLPVVAPTTAPQTSTMPIPTRTP